MSQGIISELEGIADWIEKEQIYRAFPEILQKRQKQWAESLRAIITRLESDDAGPWELLERVIDVHQSPGPPFYGSKLYIEINKALSQHKASQDDGGMPDTMYCPFCGRGPEIVEDMREEFADGTTRDFVRCSNGACPLHECIMSIEAWNTRHSEAGKVGEDSRRPNETGLEYCDRMVGKLKLAIDQWVKDFYQTAQSPEPLEDSENGETVETIRAEIAHICVDMRKGDMPTSYIFEKLEALINGEIHRDRVIQGTYPKPLEDSEQERAKNLEPHEITAPPPKLFPEEDHYDETTLHGKVGNAILRAGRLGKCPGVAASAAKWERFVEALERRVDELEKKDSEKASPLGDSERERVRDIATMLQAELDRLETDKPYYTSYDMSYVLSTIEALDNIAQRKEIWPTTDPTEPGWYPVEWESDESKIDPVQYWNGMQYPNIPCDVSILRHGPRIDTEPPKGD